MLVRECQGPEAAAEARPDWVSQCSAADLPSLLVSSCSSDLDRIAHGDLEAVVWRPSELPHWHRQCAAAVESGQLQIPRLVANGLDTREIRSLCRRLIPGDNPFATELSNDAEWLAETLERITKWRRFQFRIFTEAPSSRCGFHVDTVPPGAPPIGIVRVYSGEPTIYAERSNLLSMRSFYHYLARRQRLFRDLEDGEPGASQALAELDQAPPFLADPARTFSTERGDVVVFRHLDAGDHWSSDRSGKAWIHCSPMTGGRRLVVNVSPSR